MRELVLNHASFFAPHESNLRVWLTDLAAGIGQLTKEYNQCAPNSLRACRSLDDILCRPNYSLADAIRELLRTGARDEYLFFMHLSVKVPLLNEVRQDAVGRFRACEAHTLSAEDGEPLLLCALEDWIAVGFPSAAKWDRDQATVYFDKMSSDTTIETASKSIDNLTRSKHAAPILERHRKSLRGNLAGDSFWQDKGKAFPHLTFGPDVEGQMLQIQEPVFQTVIEKLAQLDKSAALWHVRRDSAPPWQCKVTPESNSVRNNPKLRNVRRFRSSRGTMEVFEWHARFGNSGRIHLRFESPAAGIDIGYIGKHLPP